MLTGAVWAQDKYPSRPIEMVIPMGAGGTNDQIGRIYADQLGKDLGVTITAVNRTGGTGVQGTIYVTKARKDGYTFMIGSGAWLSYQPVVNKEVPYDPLKDFIPLGFVASVPQAIVVRNDSPFKTLGELVEYARKNPGKLKNAVGGLLTESHFSIELLCYNENIKITTVPFTSGADSMTALLGGHVDIASNTLPSLGPQITAGQLRGLSVSSKTRHPDFPNILTTAELGYPYLNLLPWWGFYLPAGVPQEVVNVMTSAVEKVSRNPEVIQRIARLGFIPEYRGPEELRKHLEEEIKMVRRVAESAGLIK